MAVWTVNLPQDGQYQVYVSSVPSDGGRRTYNARYEITTAQGTGTNSQLYASGTAGTATTGTGTITTTIQFGRHASQTRWWNGDITDMLIYNRALTATEVQLRYDSGRQ